LKKKVIILIIAIFMVGIIYKGSEVFYYMNRYYLTYPQGSYDLKNSQEHDLYIGLYQPDKEFVLLKDGRELQVSNAWLEHQFVYEKKIFFFNQVKKQTKGYYFYILPLKHKNIIIDDPLNSNYFLDLHTEDEKYTDSPGFGFNQKYGFQVYLDTIPEVIRFHVKQKGSEGWKNSEIVDTITFTKRF
jgi:hypothetical protein